jgi:hypothetical protein
MSYHRKFPRHGMLALGEVVHGDDRHDEGEESECNQRDRHKNWSFGLVLLAR